MRTPAVLAHQPAQAYAHTFSCTPYCIIISYYSFDFVCIALFVFASEEKDHIGWLYFVLVLYHPYSLQLPYS